MTESGLKLKTVTAFDEVACSAFYRFVRAHKLPDLLDQCVRSPTHMDVARRFFGPMIDNWKVDSATKTTMAKTTISTKKREREREEEEREATSHPEHERESSYESSLLRQLIKRDREFERGLRKRELEAVSEVERSRMALRATNLHKLQSKIAWAVHTNALVLVFWTDSDYIPFVRTSTYVNYDRLMRAIEAAKEADKSTLLDKAMAEQLCTPDPRNRSGLRFEPGAYTCLTDDVPSSSASHIEDKDRLHHRRRRPVRLNDHASWVDWWCGEYEAEVDEPVTSIAGLVRDTITEDVEIMAVVTYDRNMSSETNRSSVDVDVDAARNGANGRYSIAYNDSDDACFRTLVPRDTVWI